MSTKSPIKFGHQEHTQFMEEGYVKTRTPPVK